jgi:two-component system response regulator FixJ
VRTDPTVFIVDDDEQLRKSLSFLIAGAGFAAETYATAEAMLADYDPQRPGCVLLDLRMGGMDGLQLQAELQAREIQIPVIIISRYADVPSVVQAVKNGAIDVIEKPFKSEVLLERVRSAIERDLQLRQENAKLTAHLASLSSRQREVMHLLTTGRGTKQIAHDLGISAKTVEKHRAQVLERMGVDSVVELTRIVLRSNLPALQAAKRTASDPANAPGI